MKPRVGEGEIQLKESGDNLKTKPFCHLPWSPKTKMLRVNSHTERRVKNLDLGGGGTQSKVQHPWILCPIRKILIYPLAKENPNQIMAGPSTSYGS